MQRNRGKQWNGKDQSSLPELKIPREHFMDGHDKGQKRMDLTEAKDI